MWLSYSSIVQEMSSRRWTPTDDYYEILGLSQNGTENEIKVAYRRLSLIVHPDRNNWSFIPKAREIAEIVFKILNNANETLMDKTKRREYDLNVYRHIRSARAGLPKQDAESLFNSMLSGQTPPGPTATNSQEARDNGKDEYAKRARENERARRQRAQEDASAQEKDKQWWEEGRRYYREKRANENREKEEAARARERADTEARAWQEQRRGKEEARHKRVEIEEKWIEIAKPLDIEVEALWTKIQAMGDMLANMDATGEYLQSQRGKYFCLWHGCFDGGSMSQNQDALIEKQYIGMDICRRFAREQREIYWDQVSEVEIRRDKAWEKEIYEKAGLDIKDWWVHHSQSGHRRAAVRSKKEALDCEEEEKARKRLHNTQSAAERRQRHVWSCQIKAQEEEKKRQEMEEFRV